jgi:hypothetical protein
MRRSHGTAGYRAFEFIVAHNAAIRTNYMIRNSDVLGTTRQVR